MESRTYIIGRSRSCDIQFSDATVSGRHAELIVMDDLIHLADLGSTNGTYVLTKEGFKSFSDGYVKKEQKFAFGHYVCSILQLMEMLHQMEQPQAKVSLAK